MKKIISLITVFLMMLGMLSGCAAPALQEPGNEPLSETQDSTTNSVQTAKDRATGFGGQLTVEMNFTRGATMASSQYAVWIENDAGELVKTLYVSDFTAGGGYDFREDAVPTWVAKAKPEEMPDAEIDAISGVTPQSGIQRYLWDGRDESGMAVANGIYHVYVEGTLYWSSTVLFFGDIEWGAAEQNITLKAVYTEENTTENRDMLTNVTASYSAI